MLGYDYEIHYRPRDDNKAADALSRSPIDHKSLTQVLAMDTVATGSEVVEQHHSWMDDLRRYNEGDPWIISKKQQVLTGAGPTLQSPPQSLSTTNHLLIFHIDNGLLKYNSRIVLSPGSVWIAKVFVAHHLILSVGHVGFLKTYQRLSQSFYWTSMKNNVQTMVVKCHTC